MPNWKDQLLNQAQNYLKFFKFWLPSCKLLVFSSLYRILYICVFEFVVVSKILKFFKYLYDL